jgi:hypothetical protein
MNISQNTLSNILDNCYDVALKGLPKTKSCYDFASEYTQKYSSTEEAIDKFIKWQIRKCTTSGFLTNLGGVVTLPVAIPANLTSVWYIQLRMIATIATMSGYNPSDDEVQTLAYLCLTGTSIAQICKEAGIQVGQKITVKVIEKIPTEFIYKINRIAMQRLITKFGTTGAINLGKMVPLVGGTIGGTFDYISTKAIAAKAKNTFFLDIID